MNARETPAWTWPEIVLFWFFCAYVGAFLGTFTVGAGVVIHSIHLF